MKRVASDADRAIMGGLICDVQGGISRSIADYVRCIGRDVVSRTFAPSSSMMSRRRAWQLIGGRRLTADCPFVDDLVPPFITICD